MTMKIMTTKRILFYGVLFFSFLVSITNISSCKKSDDSKFPDSYFIWTFEGQTYISDIDSSYKLGLGQWSIMAGNGTTMHSLSREIAFVLSSVNVGTYSFGSGSPNHMGYINDFGTYFPVSSGTMNITANSNNIVSGNFSVNVGNASTGIKPISGSFYNISITP